MMESAWRPAVNGPTPDWMAPWMEPFARTIDAAKKYVVSSKLERVEGIATGGVKLPMTLAELGLIDEYEFVVHPRIVGRGPTLVAGLSKLVDLKFVGRHEYASGAVAMLYEPRR